MEENDTKNQKKADLLNELKDLLGLNQ